MSAHLTDPRRIQSGGSSARTAAGRQLSRRLKATRSTLRSLPLHGSLHGAIVEAGRG
jgi:hypothetical protein